MPRRVRRPPDPRFLAVLAAKFATLDHLTALGLGSELVEHTLFAPLGWCCCDRCLFWTPEVWR